MSRRVTRFAALLDLVIASRYPSARLLLKAIGEEPTYKKVDLIRKWRQGRTNPRYGRHIRLVKKIEKQFGLEEGRLTKLIRGTSSSFFDDVKNRQPQTLQLIREHLPEDFDIRPEKEKQEILEWISANVLTAASAFGRYQSKATRQKIAIVFPVC